MPGLLVWPKHIPQPRTTTVPAVSSDYFPTIVDILGIDPPDVPLDGISLWPLIQGQVTKRNAPIGFQSRDQIAWMTDQYKIYSPDKGRTWQLYDLVRDPAEQTDLATGEEDRVRALTADVEKWLSSCRNSDGGGDY